MPGVTQRATLEKHDIDPKIEVQNDVAEHMEAIQVLGTQVMVGIYVRPEKTAGGIIRVQTTRDEDKFQGIVGLVLKAGAAAFVEDDQHKWGGVVPVVGDWVVFNVGDGWAFNLGSRRCRMIEDVHIKAIIARPDLVL